MIKNVVFKIQADTKQLTRELDVVQKQLQTNQKEANNFNSTVQKAGASLGLALGAGLLLQVGKNAVVAAGDYENLNIAFETFLGDAEQAKTVLADLNKFANVTPFTPDEVQKAGKALLAFNEPVDQLQGTLKNIGDISAGTGKNFNELAIIYGKARVAGTLYAEDINQLIEAGIPVLDEFSKQLNVPVDQVKKLASEGKISFSNLETAFASLTGEGGRFNGLMERLSKSTTGQISEIQGDVEGLTRAFGKGLIPVVQLLLSGVKLAINALIAFPSFVDRNRVAIGLLSAVTLVLIGRQKAQAQATLIQNVQNGIAAAKTKALSIQTGFAAAVTRLLGTAQANQTLIQRAQTVATNIGTVAMEGFTTAVKANPLGLLLGVAALAITVFSSFSDSVDEAATEVDTFITQQKAVAEFTKISKERIAEQSAELKVEFDQLKKTTAGSKERAAMIDQINQKYGTTLKNLKDEKLFVEQVDAAYQGLLSSLKQKVLFETRQEQLTTLFKQEFTISEEIFKSGALTRLLADFKGIENPLTVDPKLLDANTRAAVEVYNTLDSESKKQVEADVKRRKEAAAKIQKDQASGSGVTPFFTPQQDVKNKLGDGLSGEADAKLIQQFNETRAAVNALTVSYGEAAAGVSTFITKGKATSDQLAQMRKFVFDLTREIRKLQLDLNQQSIQFINPDNLQEQLAVMSNLFSSSVDSLNNDINNRIEDARAEGLLSNEVAKQFEVIRNQEFLKLQGDFQKQKSDLIREAEKKRLADLENIRQLDFDIQLFQVKNETEKQIQARADLEKQLEGATKEQKPAIQASLDVNLEGIKASLEKEKQIQSDAIIDARDEKLKNASLTAEEIQLINTQAYFDLLKLEADYVAKSGKLTKDKTDKEKQLEKDKNQVIKDGLKSVAKEALDLIDQLIAARIREADQAISAQEKRIEQARALAEQGNAELLQAEQERLDKLNQQRAKFVAVQQGLAALELVANSAVAISKAAAEGGAAAPFTIAATLIALAAGLIAAKSNAQAAAAGFWEGGYTGDARGGYTGTGGRREYAGPVHKEEFVFNQPTTRRFRKEFESIHKGRNPFLSRDIAGRVVVMNNFGVGDQLTRIEKAIKDQPGVEMNITDKGIHAVVSKVNWKENRIRNKSGR